MLIVIAICPSKATIWASSIKVIVPLPSKKPRPAKVLTVRKENVDWMVEEGNEYQ